MQTVFTFSLFTKYTALFFRTHGQSVRICKNSFHVYWISRFLRYRPSICQEQWLTKFDKRTIGSPIGNIILTFTTFILKKTHHHHKNLQLPPNVLADDQLLVEVTASKSLYNISLWQQIKSKTPLYKCWDEEFHFIGQAHLLPFLSLWKESIRKFRFWSLVSVQKCEKCLCLKRWAGIMFFYHCCMICVSVSWWKWFAFNLRLLSV